MRLYKATTANGSPIKDGTVDPSAGDRLIEVDAVPCDDAASERAQYALTRFLFPGYVVPRAEMVNAVLAALAGGDDWQATLPSRRVATGEQP